MLGTIGKPEDGGRERGGGKGEQGKGRGERGGEGCKGTRHGYYTLDKEKSIKTVNDERVAASYYFENF